MSVCSCPVNIQANPTLGRAVASGHPAAHARTGDQRLGRDAHLPVLDLRLRVNKNKFAKKTTHKGQWICQGGHDCGMLIPDVTMPIVGNLLYALHWPFSKGP